MRVVAMTESRRSVIDTTNTVDYISTIVPVIVCTFNLRVLSFSSELLFSELELSSSLSDKSLSESECGRGTTAKS